MTLIDLILDRCVCTVDEAIAYNVSNEELGSLLADAILELHGTHERVIKLFILENYVQIHVTRELSFIGIIENNVLGFYWKKR